MNANIRWIIVAMGLLLLPAVGPQALRYEIIAEEDTILCDDTDAIVMDEYLRRVRDSLVKEKPRTAAAELRRVAVLAGRAADSSSGEARDVLKVIQSQALKLAYAAETNSESAARQIREFALRTENFIEGEWTILEAKRALARGDIEATRVLLAVAAQQMERRAQRTAKDRGSKFEDVAREIRGFLKEQDALKSAGAGQRIADLATAAHDLASTGSRQSKSFASETSSEYSEYPTTETSPETTEEPSISKSYDSNSYRFESRDSRSGKSSASGSGTKKKPSQGRKGPSKSKSSGSKSSDVRSSDDSSDTKSEDSSASETKSYDSKSSDSDTSSSESSESTPSNLSPDDSEP
jgi:hypothetical protein